MIVALDIGNTALKWGVVDGHAVRESGRVLHRETGLGAALAALPAALADAPHIVAVNVAGSAAVTAVEAWARNPVEWFRVSAAAGGVRNGYARPEQLGVDRWAMLMGARRLAQRPWVVVGCGTAVTIDLLAGDGQHLGGYIVPGMWSMRSLLAGSTVGVRVEAVPPDIAPARDTASAVAAGSRRALTALVASVRDDAPKDPAGPWGLLFTGGDAPVLLADFPAAHHEPHLVLLGAAALRDHAAP